MYALEVREHIMIAHSFKGDFFGPDLSICCGTLLPDSFLKSKWLLRRNKYPFTPPMLSQGLVLVHYSERRIELKFGICS
jgi:hypothetical protein